MLTALLLLLSTSGPITATPKEIAEAYAKNEVGADNLYKGKRVRVFGLIADIRKDLLKTITVSIRNDEQFGTLSCSFGDKWSKQVGALERDELVAIECTGQGLAPIDRAPRFSDCAVLTSQPKDIDAFARLLGPSYELCYFDRFPSFAKLLDAGTQPDGGELPPEMLDKMRTAMKESSSSLAELHKKRLPCDDRFIWLFISCENASHGRPECKSPLIESTWAHVHHDSPPPPEQESDDEDLSP